MLEPETILQDRYRIVGQLGQGGMGAVYEAIDQRLDATVALKETLFTEDRLRRQFEREARLLARLHHAALPRVSDHFTERGGEFLVMQYIPGDDLNGIMAQRREPFPQEQVAVWADQLLDALDYLHTQDPQIVHRDIKPQNLKLTGRGQIVLLDFGLAKGQVLEFSQVTASASIFGYTPNYAPLEQVQGLGTDPRSDLYALAATLYHLVTGSKPPDALTRAAAIVNGQTDPLQPANQVNPAVTPAFAEVLRRGMAQNRDQRYANAAEMRKALHSGSDETIAFAGEAATVLLPGQSTQVVAPAGTIVSEQPTMLSGETTVLRTAPAPAKKRTNRWLVGGAVVVLAIAAAAMFYAFGRSGNSSPVGLPGVTPSPVSSIQVAQPSPSATESRSAAAATGDPEKEQAQKEAKKQEAARKKEQAEKQKEVDEAKAAEKSDRAARSRRSAAGAEHPEAPTPPDTSVDVPNPNRTGPRGRPMVRTRRDGAKVMVTPNGTRIITYPDGSTQVIPPGPVFRPGPGARARRRP